MRPFTYNILRFVHPLVILSFIYTVILEPLIGIKIIELEFSLNGQLRDTRDLPYAVRELYGSQSWSWSWDCWVDSLKMIWGRDITLCRSASSSDVSIRGKLTAALIIWIMNHESWIMNQGGREIANNVEDRENVNCWINVWWHVGGNIAICFDIFVVCCISAF